MIVIIGAGIAGLSVAHALVKRGEAVTVIDAGSVGSGASGVATSYLEPRLGKTAMRRVEWEALARWPDYAANLQEETGLDVEFRTEGQIRVTLEENLQKFERDIEARAAQDWAFERLTVEDARDLAPALSPDIAAAAYLDNVRWVTGKKVCDALAAAIRKAGSTVLEHCRVTTVMPEADSITVRLENGTSMGADRVIVCIGMGANDLAGLPEDTPKSRPVRGVNLVIDQSSLPKPFTHMVKHHRGNICPRSGGRLIVGTTYEPEETSLVPPEDIIERLYQNAEPILPSVRSLPLLEVTAGLRTKVGDGNLWLGRSKSNRNVYFSLSHAGAGFLRAPVVGDEFASFVLTDAVGEFTAPATHV